VLTKPKETSKHENFKSKKAKL